MGQKPVSDFDTREPQEPKQPNKLRVGMMATKLRILLVANKLRSGLLAKRLLSLLWVVAFVALVLFMVAVTPLGQRIPALSWLDPETVTCDTWMLGKAGVCHPPTGKPYLICMATSRDAVNSSDGCSVSGPL
jgi:hypothetical protein